MDDDGQKIASLQVGSCMYTFAAEKTTACLYGKKSSYSHVSRIS
jgi:hypothetical protein